MEAITGSGSTMPPKQGKDADGTGDVDEQTKAQERMKGIQYKRIEFFREVLNLLSAKFVFTDDNGLPPKRSSASRLVLLQAGIDTSDPVGWTVSTDSNQPGAPNMGKCAMEYMDSKDSQVPWLLSSLLGLLNDYYQRIELIEGYVYMELVGIQVERYFSKKRASALAAFEKKTDITTAMNIATRKRLPQLIKELQGKMNALGPEVSQTSVREAKEAHLESKNIKGMLHNVAVRRLTRARESSTERAVHLLSFWAKEEESAAKDELKKLRTALSDLERVVSHDSAQLLACGVVVDI